MDIVTLFHESAETINEIPFVEFKTILLITEVK